VSVFRFGGRSIAAAIVAALAVFSASAAQAPGSSASAAAASDDRLAQVRRHIKYVFIIYQENRSFDSYFGTFPGADGLYSDAPARIPGFSQPILNIDGSTGAIEPFRIGPAQMAADTDDVDHGHAGTVAKMDVVDGVPQMDHFALAEERKHVKSGNPSLAAKQFGELAMAHEDCDTVPFLWRFADKFSLYDHIFEAMTGPSTPGNLTIIAAQTGVTQWLLHPDQASGLGGEGSGVPVFNDDDPYWGSPSDRSANPMPVNPDDYPGYPVQRNLTFASLPITLAGRTIGSVTGADADPSGDLTDIRDDISYLDGHGSAAAIPWGWYEEGYDSEPSPGGADPTDAAGLHASYITHHNGPQYFGYIANEPAMRQSLHGLGDLMTALKQQTLSPIGGVYYVKGGYRNILGLRPADPDPVVQKSFLGDDDHPGYSDAQISEAMVATIVNRIARSKYWDQSAIIITWDDAEGDYDHVPPPIRYTLPGEAWVSDGPRVPLLLISPYARSGAIVHDVGDQASVVKLVDEVFGLTPLAVLPDESRARSIGRARFGIDSLGPLDDPNNALSDLLSGFDAGRLSGTTPLIPASDAIIPDATIATLPQASGYGCRSIGIVPTDIQMGIANPIPPDFNPRPKTEPTSPTL